MNSWDKRLKQALCARFVERQGYGFAFNLFSLIMAPDDLAGETLDQVYLSGIESSALTAILNQAMGMLLSVCRQIEICLSDFLPPSQIQICDLNLSAKLLPTPFASA